MMLVIDWHLALAGIANSGCQFGGHQKKIFKSLKLSQVSPELRWNYLRIIITVNPELPLNDICCCFLKRIRYPGVKAFSILSGLYHKGLM